MAVVRGVFGFRCEVGLISDIRTPVLVFSYSLTGKGGCVNSDRLNWLTEANYSKNDYYHYTYDAVGNRETQQKSVLGFVTNDTYIYDDANRLTSLNGVTYTWDNNGNLLNDGVNTYTYDFANRLKTLTGQGNTVTYTYNGLGDRLRETVNGNPTTFTMDLNTGLTQALSDGTNTYIYGLGRIAQVNSNGTEYFLNDALNSVRQMTDASGEITYARAYDPYSVVASTSGSSQSAYAFAGESYGDSTQLLYLRARYYASGMGRFLTRDTWEGDANNPLSLKKWNYVSGNPINKTDPTGLCEESADEACWALYNEIIRWRPDLANANIFIGQYEGGLPLRKASYQQLKFILDNKLWSICLFTPQTEAENTTRYTSCHAISWVNKHRAKIVSAAQRNGVPPELPAGILASEIDFDTDWRDIAVDTAFRVHTAELSVALLAGIGLTHKPLGPGTASIHLDTWLLVQDYFGHCAYLPSAVINPVNVPSTIVSVLDWVSAMETPLGAIEGSAAVSRFLADYRTGSNGQPNKATHFNDLDTVDMAQIFGAYRRGVGGLTCFNDPDHDGSHACGFPFIRLFQDAPNLGDEARQAYPYFEFFQRYFEYYPRQGE
jgi:RHS repeat-associated protein